MSRPHDNTALARCALQALRTAALLLPGLVPGAAQAASADDQLNLQFSRYEEGQRDLGGVPQGIAPLTADTLRLSGSKPLGESNGLRFSFSQDTWSGATPIATAPLAAQPNRAVLRDSPNGVIASGASPYLNASLTLDAQGRPLVQDQSGALRTDTRDVLVLSEASPELRQQLDLGLSTELGAFDGVLGLSYSTEPDYVGRGVNAGISRDFNRQLTTLSFNASFSEGLISARLDHDALPYLERGAWQAALVRDATTERFFAKRHDQRVELGLTQVIDASSYLEAALGYGEGGGYLGNPYKAVSVLFSAPAVAGGTRRGELRALLERRPDTQQQAQLDLHYARALPFADGALHLNYQYSQDSWDLRAHSMELRWVQPLGAWTFTPHLRGYAQSEAEFYTAHLVSDQAWRRDYDAALLPAHYSSDHRLASFGSVNGGLTVSRRFTNGVRLEGSVGLYRRRADWGRGGDDSSFADFRFTQFNLGLQLDLAARSANGTAMNAMHHAGHEDGDTHQAMPLVPAGLSFVHARHAPGALAFGYQVRNQRQGGQLHDGDHTLDDATVVAQGCGDALCRFAPASMAMQMHMFMLTYQWRENLSLMLMPQYMSMDMDLRPLAGRPPPQLGEHVHGPGGHHTGSIGDTVVAATWQPPTSPWQWTLGLSLPTGSVDLEYRRQNRVDGGLMHFDMQSGSGTWDLLPALTWQGGAGAWQLGAQVNGVARFGQRNDSGYRLGDRWQASAWTAHPVTSWLAGSLRLTHTWQGTVDGDFSAYNARLGPMDYPFNQGGRYTDLGLGLGMNLPGGQQLALEWEEPLQDDPHGIQLERVGQWSLSWHLGF